jgi:hypothetical protein
MDVLEVLRAIDSGVAIIVLVWVLTRYQAQQAELIDTQRELLESMLEKLNGDDAEPTAKVDR